MANSPIHNKSRSLDRDRRAYAPSATAPIRQIVTLTMKVRISVRMITPKHGWLGTTTWCSSHMKCRVALNGSRLLMFQGAMGISRMGPILPPSAECFDEHYRRDQLLAADLRLRLFVLKQGLFRVDDIQIADQARLIAVLGNAFLIARTGNRTRGVLLLESEKVQRRKLIFHLLIRSQDRLLILRNGTAVTRTCLVEVGTQASARKDWCGGGSGKRGDGVLPVHNRRRIRALEPCKCGNGKLRKISSLGDPDLRAGGGHRSFGSDDVRPPFQQLRRHPGRDGGRRLERGICRDVKPFGRAPQQLGNRVLHLRALDVHCIALAAHLIEQRLCLLHIQLAYKPMLELVIDNLIAMLQRVYRRIENMELSVGLTQVVVIDGHGGTDRQLDETQVRGRSLRRGLRRLNHATDFAPCIDLVIQGQRKKQIVERGGGAGLRHVTWAVLSHSRSRERRTCAYRG